jgi:hypothetical protein
VAAEPAGSAGHGSYGDCAGTHRGWLPKRVAQHGLCWYAIDAAMAEDDAATVLALGPSWYLVGFDKNLAEWLNG